ncbi:hypothetical protein ACM26S_09325 [Kluyvera sichuanensis]|uniref:hypothetical protein n=1 Tax=Kluyvera sichuanensis TaxID=2725494 RepID=UPI0039F6D4AB
MAVQNRDVNKRKAWPLVAMLALIYLLVMHLVIANMGGSGSELPTSLWVWFCMLLLLGCGWPCFVRTAIAVAPAHCCGGAADESAAGVEPRAGLAS